jgi:hypothetical protein
VGVTAEEVLDRLGVPPGYEPSDAAIAYRGSAGPETASPGTGVIVTFFLDGAAGRVREIVWKLEPWH